MANAPATVEINQVPEFSINIGSSEFIKSSFIQRDDLYKMEFLYSPCKKDNSPIKGIQRTIKNLQNELENIKKYTNINLVIDGLIKDDTNTGKIIKNLLSGSSSEIASYVKNILNDARGWVYNKVQESIKKPIIGFLFPGEIPEITKKINDGIDGISCAFAKVVRSLKTTVLNLLFQLIDRYTNGPLCLIEDFLNNLLQKILDPIFSAINSALNLISPAVSFIEDIGDELFNLLDFVTGILNFFKCDDDRSCPIVSETNLAGMLWKGGDSIPLSTLFNISTNIYPIGNTGGGDNSTPNQKISNSNFNNFF